MASKNDAEIKMNVNKALDKVDPAKAFPKKMEKIQAILKMAPLPIQKDGIV